MNQLASLLERVKTLEDLGSALIMGGMLTIGLGVLLELEGVVNLGVAILGAGIVAWGVNAITSRELRVFQRGIRISQRIEETLARAWGILFALGGLLMLGYGALSMLNARAPIPAGVRGFFATPQGVGVLLLVGATVGILFALTSIFVSDADGGNAFVRCLKSLPGRLFGVVLLVFFGALALVALMQVFAPSAWEGLWQELLRALGIL